jgi:hypothetical protein
MKATRRGRSGLLLALGLLGASPPEPAPTDAVRDPIIEVERPAEPMDLSKLGAKVFDVLVLRPAGLTTIAVGAGAFVLAAPVSVFGAGIGQTWDTFVMQPVDFTFSRPLGDF